MKKNIDKLEAIQLHGAHWVCGSRYNRGTFLWSKQSIQCCSELNWPPLPPDVIISPLLQYMLSSYISALVLIFTVFFLLFLMYSISSPFSILYINSYRYSFFANGIILWNSIHHSTLSISDHSAFKKSLYIQLFNHSVVFACSYLFCCLYLSCTFVYALLLNN